MRLDQMVNGEVTSKVYEAEHPTLQKIQKPIIISQKPESNFIKKKASLPPPGIQKDKAG